MILCCGEALIDMLPRTSDAGEPAFAPYAGGAVFNTAVALGRLGAPAAFYCGLANDMFGEQLRQVLEDSKVDTRYAPVVDRPCTIAFVRLVDGQATYAFYDEGTAMRMMTPEELPDLSDDVSTLFFGCISLVSEPCGTAFETLMARESARRVIMIDPNIRPSFITDEIAFRGRMERMVAQSDIVKVSDEDLHWLEGEGDIATLARAMLQKGPKVVMVTEGAKGAHGFTAEHAVQVPAPKVTVADTIGAGDTFDAGAMAALSDAGALSKEALGALSAEVLTDTVAMGVRTAAVTVSRAGANPPWAHEL